MPHAPDSPIRKLRIVGRGKHASIQWRPLLLLLLLCRLRLASTLPLRTPSSLQLLTLSIIDEQCERGRKPDDYKCLGNAIGQGVGVVVELAVGAYHAARGIPLVGVAGLSGVALCVGFKEVYDPFAEGVAFAFF